MFQRHVGKLLGENVNNNRTTVPLFAKLDKKYWRIRVSLSFIPVLKKEKLCAKRK